MGVNHANLNAPHLVDCNIAKAFNAATADAAAVLMLLLLLLLLLILL